jgi:hypothetical protein
MIDFVVTSVMLYLITCLLKGGVRLSSKIGIASLFGGLIAVLVRLLFTSVIKK